MHSNLNICIIGDGTHSKRIQKILTGKKIKFIIFKPKIKEDYEALIVVKSCNIEYKKPSYLEDDLKIRSFVKSITKTSFFMSQYISRDDELIVEAKVHLVFVDKNGKPIKVPEDIFKVFKPYFCDSIKIK